MTLTKEQKDIIKDYWKNNSRWSLENAKDNQSGDRLIVEIKHREDSDTQKLIYEAVGNIDLIIQYSVETEVFAYQGRIYNIEKQGDITQIYKIDRVCKDLVRITNEVQHINFEPTVITL